MLPVGRLAGDLFGLLFPNLCNGCGKQLFHGEKHLCTRCLYDLPYTDFHHYSDNMVSKLFWGRLVCHAAMAMLYFRKGSRVQNIIHCLKYKHQSALGVAMGRLLGERLLVSPAYQTAELIIPVPLHPKRERERGYNQSKCIADGIAEILKIPVNTTQLIRHKATTTQTRKNRFSRFENMQDVFKVKDPESLKGKHVLLVDDVITTGSTLEACGILLFNHKIKKLSIAALAYVE